MATSTQLRRGSVAAMVLAPMGLAVGTALLPSQLGDRIDGSAQRASALLAAVSPHRDRLLLAVLLISLGLGLLVPTAYALRSLAPVSRSSSLGAALVTVGAPVGIMLNAASIYLAYKVSSPKVPQASAVTVLTVRNPAIPIFLVYLLAVVGLAVLAGGAWRAGNLNGWIALLVGGGAVVGFLAPEGPAGGIATVPLVIGLVLLALRAEAVHPAQGLVA